MTSPKSYHMEQTVYILVNRKDGDLTLRYT